MEDFVPRKLAVKLKEKGFKEKCYAYYFPVNNELVYNTNQFRGGILYDNLHSYNSLPNEVLTSDFIDAPTISQVLKWLREEKKIFVSINYYPAGYNADIYTGLSQKDGFFDNERYIDECDCFNTYEEAAIAGIEYVINNLI